MPIGVLSSYLRKVKTLLFAIACFYQIIVIQTKKCYENLAVL